MKNLSATIHSPCDELYYYQDEHTIDQCRGVTTWNLENEFTVQPILTPYAKATVIFTCTTPRCYSQANTIEGGFTIYGQDACNVVFNAWRTGSGTAETSIPLYYILNDKTVGVSYLSEVSTHGATQAYELANINVAEGSIIYNDRGLNTLVFQNNSTSTIQLDHVKLYRTYKMCNPRADYSGSCTFDTGGPCYSGAATGTSGGFDATRIDTPCLCDGGGLSATHWQDTTKEGSIIQAGKTLSWTFNFGDLPDNPHRNYVGKSICLFNFNNVQATTGADGDIALDARLNSSLINTYYLSGKMEGNVLPLAPSHDLAKEGDYKDTLPNTIDLINTSSVGVKMVGEDGGIDIYRIFQKRVATFIFSKSQT